MLLSLFTQLFIILSIIASGVRPVDDPIAGLLLIALAVTTCYANLKQKAWDNYSLSMLMLVYLAWLFVIALLSTVPNISMMTLPVLAAMPVLYLVATNTASFNELWKILIPILILTGVFSALWAIYQVYYHVDLAQGPLEDRNAFASLMNILWFLTTHLFLTHLKKTNKTTPFLLGVGLFIISVGLFATSSRGGIGTWLLLQPILIWSIFKYTRSFKVVAIVPTIAALAFMFSSIQLGNDVTERKVSIKQLSQDESTSARLMLWESTANIARDNPVFGTGWGTFTNHYPAYRNKQENTTAGLYAHNDYLQFAAEGGFIGLLFLLAILLNALLQLRQNLKDVKNEANFESSLLLIGVLALFIHATVNFIFYYTFINAIAGLYLARVALLTQKPSTISLANLSLFRPYAKRIIAAFIILLIAAPFVSRQISMSTLSNNQIGLKAINTIIPSITASDIAKLMTAIYPKELVAQQFTLLEIETTLANSNFNDSTHYEIKSQFLVDAIKRFDLIRSQSANNPDIGVREANILINYHSFFDNGFAYEKASKILSENIKTMPYHPDTYIMQSRLQTSKGDRSKALETLRNAEQKMMYQLDHRLIYVEILRLQSDTTEAEELNKLENDIRQARINIDSGKRHLVPANFGPNLDARLNAIKQKITIE